MSKTLSEILDSMKAGHLDGLQRDIDKLHEQMLKEEYETRLRGDKPKLKDSEYQALEDKVKKSGGQVPGM